MAAKYLLRSELHRRIPGNESHARLLHCIYHEHLIYTGNEAIDNLHEAHIHFPFAHYLSFKRSKHSLL